MVAEKAHRSGRALQSWHVDVEVQAVDPLDRQSDMIGEKRSDVELKNLRGRLKECRPASTRS